MHPGIFPHDFLHVLTNNRTLAYQFLVGLPWPNVLLPIALPTLYLWIVDTFALQRGTWVIEEGTKLGVYLWPGLEIEYVSLLDVSITC